MEGGQKKIYNKRCNLRILRGRGRRSIRKASRHVLIQSTHRSKIQSRKRRWWWCSSWRLSSRGFLGWSSSSRSQWRRSASFCLRLLVLFFLLGHSCFFRLGGDSLYFFLLFFWLFGSLSNRRRRSLHVFFLRFTSTLLSFLRWPFSFWSFPFRRLDSTFALAVPDFCSACGPLARRNLRPACGPFAPRSLRLTFGPSTALASI